MSKSILLLLIVIFVSHTLSAQIKPDELLKQSSKYHDPVNRWNELAISMQITSSLEPPISKNFGFESYHSSIQLNNLTSTHTVTTQLYGNQINLKYIGDECEISVNGDSAIPEDVLKKLMPIMNLSDCASARTGINYHLYLTGLPMKLWLDKADYGEVTEKSFFGKEYYSITVKYTADTWQFYFNKEDYSLAGYEFKFNQQDFGEKILLGDFIEEAGLRVATSRKWYDLSNNLLMTDQIKNVRIEFK